MELLAIHKITKAKESDRCDLCEALQIAEGRITTDDNLRPQTLGHIQHECEALSELHTLAHHLCWRIIHTELVRLASSKWRFICISGEKSLRTIWAELGVEFPEIFNLCAAQTLENTARDQEMRRPMSCVTDQYVTRDGNVAVSKYASIKSALEQTLGPQGWLVSQRSFIAGARICKNPERYVQYEI